VPAARGGQRLRRRGHVRVGTSVDTPVFAVEAIRSGWARYGCKRYRGADELLILADGGGSNGHHPRLWKAALQEQIADRYGLHVTVCHYPTGGVEVESGGAPALRPGGCQLGGPAATEPGDPPGKGPWDDGRWHRGDGEPGPGGVPDQGQGPRRLMEGPNLERHDVCPEWNYTISPRKTEPRG
jgi:Rhodopirellula transposase DDE domain